MTLPTFQRSIDLAEFNIVAVVPAYNEELHIEAVVRSLPEYITTIIVVDDASKDGTCRVVDQLVDDDPRVLLLRHEVNQGVGGAMVTGFERALQLDAQIVVKIDGDGQMSPENLEELLYPLIAGHADYTKGNRFHDFEALSQMPLLRQIGNTALSFFTKAAVGYWDLFDPCNGYVAIRGEVLTRLPLKRISKSFFFETSMLARLYLMGAVVKDVPMPARYGVEVSHMSIPRVIREFIPRLAYCFGRRMLLKNFLYNFSMESVFLLTGIPLLTWGIYFGLSRWSHYATLGEGAPTGTIVISAMTIILGFQLLLSAISEDLRSTPKEPYCRVPLQPCVLNAIGGRTSKQVREGVAPDYASMSVAESQTSTPNR